MLSEPNNRHDRQAVAIYMDGEVESNESTETHTDERVENGKSDGE